MAATKDSFGGRLALITGGSSGMGLAMARQLAEEGATVWLLARRKEPLQAALNSLSTTAGQKHGMIAADVSDWTQVQAAVERIVGEAGVPDLLINCAGVTEEGYAEDIPLEHYHQMMDINYFGTVYMVKTLVPHMLRRGSGHVVNISSIAGYLSPPGYAAYAPSKYAVRAFSDVLRAELKPRGLNVSLVFPPDTDTPQLAYEKSHKAPEMLQLQEDGGLGPFKFGVHSAEEVGRIILDDVRRGRYIILPGKVNYALYHVAHMIGNLVYPIMDSDWAAARRKRGKA